MHTWQMHASGGVSCQPKWCSILAGQVQLVWLLYDERLVLGESVNAHLPEYSTLKSFGIFSPKRFELESSSSVVVGVFVSNSGFNK